MTTISRQLRRRKETTRDAHITNGEEEFADGVLHGAVLGGLRVPSVFFSLSVIFFINGLSSIS